MTKKLIVLFALFALVAAIAGTVPVAGPSYSVKLLRPSVVKGTVLKEGEYRVNVGTDSVTIGNGKVSVEVSAKVESTDSKFPTTAIRYTEEAGKSKISEIRFGGTKTKVLLAD
ncbi:MAG: hypothetical protein JST11_11120 [Acidobacteria bacterium]|nr:hypothetical protein [Acidobacteriota bacterium]